MHIIIFDRAHCIKYWKCYNQCKLLHDINYIWVIIGILEACFLNKVRKMQNLSFGDYICFGDYIRWRKVTFHILKLKNKICSLYWHFLGFQSWKYVRSEVKRKKPYLKINILLLQNISEITVLLTESLKPILMSLLLQYH